MRNSKRSCASRCCSACPSPSLLRHLLRGHLLHAHLHQVPGLAVRSGDASHSRCPMDRTHRSPLPISGAHGSLPCLCSWLRCCAKLTGVRLRDVFVFHSESAPLQAGDRRYVSQRISCLVGRILSRGFTTRQPPCRLEILEVFHCDSISLQVGFCAEHAVFIHLHLFIQWRQRLEHCQQGGFGPPVGPQTVGFFVPYPTHVLPRCSPSPASAHLI